ncbi:hypothetical protein FE810_08065 [Thalassotalea litorea]|uniref:Uncharacterized protein n=1 Tax=Thalassotalea litorea TaxID=2020715 RepID=A0A5R9IPP8_9GAMM|nr:hypothetical protein [Thalassotalea litorea]TLU65241.1 hypothetical protein FE810_08065 [Thalassotalea litorea]
MSFWKELFDIYQHQLQSKRLAQGASRALSQEIKTNICLLAEALENPQSSSALIASLEDSAFRHYCQQGYDFIEFNQQPLSLSTTANIREFNQYLQQSTGDLIFRAYQRVRVLKAFADANSAQRCQRRIQSLLRYHVMLFAHMQAQPLRVRQ